MKLHRWLNLPPSEFTQLTLAIAVALLLRSLITYIAGDGLVSQALIESNSRRIPWWYYAFHISHAMITGASAYAVGRCA
eukprot:2479297-Karenia_brevis.AAC.1